MIELMICITLGIILSLIMNWIFNKFEKPNGED